MKATKSAAKYGLENLKTVHDAFSLGLINNHKDNATIVIPKVLEVIKYIIPN